MNIFAGSTEIQMLCWSIVLGLLQIVVCAALSTKDRGLPYNAGPRDAPPPDASNITGRLERGLRNFLETFPLFAAAVVVVSLLNKESQSSALGAQVYFWARLVYVPVYALGIQVVRTIIWALSIVGLVMVMLAAFGVA